MFTVEEIASAIDEGDEIENVMHILERIAVNPDHHVQQVAEKYPCTTKYGCL